MDLAPAGLALFFCATVANAEPAPPPTSIEVAQGDQSTDERAAATIAEQAFLEHTHHEIKDYSMRAWKHTNTEWHFFIAGEKAFIRPGNDWFVTINKQSGAVKIEAGM